MRALRAALAAVLGLLLLTVVGAGSAEAATRYGVPGSTGEFSLGGSGDDGDGIPVEAGIGVKCKVSAYWVTNNDSDLSRPVQYLAYSYGCETGWNVSDVVETFTLSNSDGSKTQNLFYAKQLDGMDGAVVTSFAAGAPFAVERLCYTGTIKAHTGGSGPLTGCTPISVLPPPAAATGPSCARGTLIEPWVTTPEVVTVSGGWVWEQHVYLRVPDKTDNTTTTTTLVGGKALFLAGFVRLRSNGTVSAGSTSTGQRYQNSYLDYGGGISFDWAQTWPDKTPGTKSVELVARGPVQTTAPGTGGPVSPVRAAGYYGYWNTPLDPPSALEVQTLSDSEWAADRYSYQRHVGATDLGKCYAAWGDDASGATYNAVGPLVEHSTGQTPDPPVTSSPPPVLDDAPPSVPDDGSGCAGFSFTDPTSWAGAGICQLVKLVLRLTSAVTAIPQAILNGLGGVFNALFVPTDLPDFGDVPSPMPEGWVPSLPNVSGGACGPLVMPALDFGDMLGTVGPTTIVDTCDAPWPTARTVVYYGLLAGALVTVGNRALRAVMAALGMSVDAPGSGGDDE